MNEFFIRSFFTYDLLVVRKSHEQNKLQTLPLLAQTQNHFQTRKNRYGRTLAIFS